MKLNLTILFLLILSIKAFSGTRTLKGYVLDIRGKPIEGFIVFANPDITYRFPINSITGQVDVLVSGIETRFNNNQPSTFELQANYPNPFDDNTSFDLSSSKSLQGTFLLFNVLGQRIFSQPINIKNGITRFNLSGQLPSGTYFLQFRSLNGKSAIKLIDIAGSLLDHDNLRVTKQSHAYSSVKISYTQNTQLIDYYSDGKAMFNVFVEGITENGKTILPYLVIRAFNQEPDLDNFATASSDSNGISSMLIDINELPDKFVLYGIDSGISLDTLFYISGPFFKSTWQDIHIDQYNRDFTNRIVGDKLSGEYFDYQNELINQLKDMLIIQTPIGSDTLVWVTHDTTSSPSWVRDSFRVWYYDSTNTPAHGVLLKYSNNAWRFVYGEGYVNSPDVSSMINELIAASTVAMQDIYIDIKRQIKLYTLISSIKDNKQVIDQRGYNYMRTGLLFKGRVIIPLK